MKEAQRRLRTTWTTIGVQTYPVDGASASARGYRRLDDEPTDEPTDAAARPAHAGRRLDAHAAPAAAGAAAAAAGAATAAAATAPAASVGGRQLPEARGRRRSRGVRSEVRPNRPRGAHPRSEVHLHYIIVL